MLDVKQNKGIGLLELMLSLAVIAILLIMATIYFKTTSQAKNVNSAIDMLQALQTSGQRWLLTNPTYNEDVITDFVNRNYLPASFADNINPWGGELTVTGNNPSGSQTFLGPWLHVSMDNIPNEACNALKVQATPLTCDNTPNYINCSPTNNNNSTFSINLPSACPATTS